MDTAPPCQVSKWQEDLGSEYAALHSRPECCDLPQTEIPSARHIINFYHDHYCHYSLSARREIVNYHDNHHRANYHRFRSAICIHLKAVKFILFIIHITKALLSRHIILVSYTNYLYVLHTLIYVLWAY